MTQPTHAAAWPQPGDVVEVLDEHGRPQQHGIVAERRGQQVEIAPEGGGFITVHRIDELRRPATREEIAADHSLTAEERARARRIAGAVERNRARVLADHLDRAARGQVENMRDVIARLRDEAEVIGELDSDLSHALARAFCESAGMAVAAARSLDPAYAEAWVAGEIVPGPEQG